MPNNTDKAATMQLALAVLDAAKIREESFDKDAAAKASMKYQRKIEKATGDEAKFINMPDYVQFYKKGLEEAAEEAAVMHSLAGSGRLIYLALDGWWNDSLDWAEEVKRGNVNG